MSPTETSDKDGFLEHPTEAFSYYRSQGVSKVVCEEKHMGSRAIVIVCRDEDVARQRFGVVGEDIGIVYTRTGRRFFSDRQLERKLLDRIQAAMTAAGFWDKFDTGWACLDCELMPWSVKAQDLLRSQYAAVGAAGRASLPKTVDILRQTMQRMSSNGHTAISAMCQRYEYGHQSIGKFIDAYRQYCWSVESIDDLKLAPFHLMATEGAVHIGQNHVWHMDTLAQICQPDPPHAFPFRRATAFTSSLLHITAILAKMPTAEAIFNCCGTSEQFAEMVRTYSRKQAKPCSSHRSNGRRQERTSQS